MVLKFWLIVNEDGGVIVRKRTPMSGTLSDAEIAVPITMDVPDAWFSRRTSVIRFSVGEPPTEDMSAEVGDVIAADESSDEAQP